MKEIIAIQNEHIENRDDFIRDFEQIEIVFQKQSFIIQKKFDQYDQCRPQFFPIVLDTDLGTFLKTKKSMDYT